MTQKPIFAGVALLCFLIAVSLYLYGGGYLHTYPGGQHSWAMSDYYSLALNFFHSDPNLFLPRTFNLGTPEGITASDLPLPAWLSAMAMRLFSTDAPVVFRVLTLLMSLSGIMFFFRALTLYQTPAYRAIVVSALFWLLPGLLFYHIGFLPSVWSLSLFLMGLWALQKDRDETQTYWLAAVGLLTLAALIRKPYVLYLGCMLVFASSREKKLILMGGLGIFCLWQMYDRWLMDHYGSIFLRNLTYPHSMQEAGQLLGAVWKKWRLNWFSIYHLLWLAAGLMVWRISPVTDAASGRRPWGRFFILCLLAACGYFTVMMRQFADHDYYVIDSFYPPVFIGVLIASRGFDVMRQSIVLELILLAIALPFAKNKLNWYQRSSGFEISVKTEKAYQNAEPLFQQLGIGKDAKILVFEAYSTNAPLNGMRRKGICLLTSKPSDQEKGFATQPDYAVCLDTNFVSEVVNDNPEVVSKLAFIGRNERFWVFKTGNYPGNTLENLLSTKEQVLHDSTARSADEFILSATLPPEPGKKVLMRGSIWSDKTGKVKPTVALFRKNGDLVAYLDKEIETGPEKTQRVVDFTLPKVQADEMRIYLWNPDRLDLAIQEFKISLLDLKPLSETPE